MNNKSNGINFADLLVRLLVSMIVIGLTNLLVPGMSNKGGFWNLALIAIVIAILQQLFVKIFNTSGAATGATGFLVTAIILYLAGKIVSGYHVNLIGALIGGLVYGLISSFVPGDKLN